MLSQDKRSLQEKAFNALNVEDTGISKVCGNLKNKRNGKEIATSSSDSERVEDTSSDE